MSDISGDGYEALHDTQSNIVTLKGTLRLNGIAEYQPITEILIAASDAGPNLTIDFRELDFLNSSGIATISKFILHARQKESFSVKILGSKVIPWQGKSLVNLRRLMPALDLEFI